MSFPNTPITWTYPNYYEGKVAYVAFYCYDPERQQLRRKRYMLTHYKTKKQRKVMAAQLITNLVQNLQRGWNPWVDTSKLPKLAKFAEIFATYANFVQRSANRNILKQKTAYDYLSRYKTFAGWVDEQAITYAYQLTSAHLVEFLDHLYYDKGLSAKTRNNYRTWLSTFFTWMIERGYIEKNLVLEVKTIREENKRRRALPAVEVKRMGEFLERTNRHFLLACMMEYYTFIRPEELRHIRIRDIHLHEQTITVDAAVSKNRRTQNVAAPARLLRLMLELDVFAHPGDCYLFGPELTPSRQQIGVNGLRKEWAKLREALRWPSAYQFYSLKDTGLIELSNKMGVVVAKDQARHTDVSTTNHYLYTGGVPAEKLKDYEGEL